MSNLYEILEVSEKASKEVIDKAYRVLAKKYHPDLQNENEKQKAENKMKQINEAYDILSNDEKRKEYNLKLEESRKKQKIEEQELINELKKQIQHTQIYKQKVEYPKTEYQIVQKQNEEIRRQQEEYKNRKQMQDEINSIYAQAYNNYLRSFRL